MSLPYVIATMRAQLGTGINGALCYVGARGLCYNYPAAAPRDREVRPDKASSVIAETGAIDAPVSLAFRVNTRRNVRVSVAYEPDDTYTVRLWRATGSKTRLSGGPWGEIIAERRDVYCDELAHVVESLYDDYIKEHQQGFIHI